MTEESLELARKCETWFAELLIGIMVVIPFIVIPRFDSSRALYIAERDHFAETTTGSISHTYYWDGSLDETPIGKGYFRVVYRYRADHMDRSAEVRVSEATYDKLGKLPIGSPVRVTYSRYDPTVSRLTDYSSSMNYTEYIYGLVTLEGLCVISLVLNRYRRSKQTVLISD